MAAVPEVIRPGANSAPQTGLVVREEFGALQSTQQAETASAALAAQAKAATEARYILAIKRPRDWDDVRMRLLKECERPSFAKVAIYHKPVGQGIEGPSIRFAEACLRIMGNVYPETMIVFDDPQKRIVRVSVTDLEGNTTYTKDVAIEKTVERKQLKKGQTAIRSRTNSYGDTVYLVEATDDEILNKENALVSKALRTNGLRLVPGDLLDEALSSIRETISRGVTEDPDAERKRLADAFADLNILPSQLKEYLGCDLAQVQPKELVELRKLYNALKEGETTWREVAAAKKGEESGETATKSASLKERVTAQAKQATPLSEEEMRKQTAERDAQARGELFDASPDEMRGKRK